MATIFDWFKSHQNNDTNDKTRQPRRIPTAVDWTDKYVANTALTTGLYHNTYPGFKLAGGLAFPPIAVPIWFMGVPIPEPVDEEDEVLAEQIEQIVEMFLMEMEQNHLISHRDGTSWIWPHWSQRGDRLIWEFIRDDTVQEIIRDLETQEIIRMSADEKITITTGPDATETVRRKRTFTPQKITIEWLEGEAFLPEGTKNIIMRNPLGIMPIPFSNNSDADEIRGHSDYERIITDLKDYHDIDLARSRMLSKFQVKMVQEGSDLETWLANNGWDSIADVDIAQIDLIYNQFEREKTTFVFPERAYEAYSETLKQKFQKIVEASGVPEIAWGLKTEGNRASVEESMGTLVKYVHDKQKQKSRQYKKLFTASLALLGMVRMEMDDPKINVTWNKLDAVSEEVRADIFTKFAQGVGSLVQNAALTKEQLHWLWKNLYPESTDDDFDNFILGLSEMGAHRQWTQASYGEALDFLGGDSEEEELPEQEELEE